MASKIKCDICGQKRDPQDIQTITTDRSLEFNVPMGTKLESVRYCTDKVLCRHRAPRTTLTK